jgi:hypothetical protein
VAQSSEEESESGGGEGFGAEEGDLRGSAKHCQIRLFFSTGFSKWLALI